MQIGAKDQSRFTGCLLGLLLATTAARAEQVVFSEIMYHPPEGLPEYLEVQNLTSTVFDLANWRLTDGARYDFPDFSEADPDRTFLKPFERIVLTGTDPEAARTAYGIPAGVRIYGPWEGDLSNAGETTRLEDQNGLTICVVTYGDRGHWSPAADGAGHSLVLVHPDRAPNDWRQWQASTRRLGTPGTAPVVASEEPVPNPEVREETGVVLVDYGDVWRFNDRAEDLGTAWRERVYDDSAWSSGPGILGWESSSLPAPGLRTEVNKGSQLTYYFRTRFDYAGTTDGVTLVVDQIVDDGVVYYLNGQELGRVGVPDGDVTFNTRANRTVSNATEETAVIQVPGTALRVGENVLAAEAHQHSTGSSDIVLAARLRALVPMATADGLVINEVRPGGPGEGFLEFYNPTDQPVNLQGHYLSALGTTLTQHRISNTTSVPPGGLAVVGFTESGFSPGNPVTVYLTAPDGESVLDAIRADVPQDGRSLGRKPEGGETWFIFAQPTQGAPNGGSDEARRALALNEAHFDTGDRVDWVEIHNRGERPLSLQGFALASLPDLSDAVPLGGIAPAGGFAVVETTFPARNGEVTLFLLDAAKEVLDAKLIERPADRNSVQAWPNGSQEWYSADTATRGAANAPARETRIIINEIMLDPPSNLVDGEYIELYNRGSEPVDVGGWRLEEAVRYRFPEGTVIPAGGYLVVAAQADWMRRTYGDILVVGNYSGRLDNEGELIRMRDQRGNLADEVDYHVGGDWPDLAAGMGSSLELRHPAMDNHVPTSWAASDESQKGPWRDFSYRGTYLERKRFGGISDYREIYFHLVGDAHVILTDLEFVKVNNGASLLRNADRLSPDNRSANGWLIQGTHWQSYLEDRSLHLISTGRGDNRPNRAEIDVPDMARNDVCELRFKARWVYGNPRLVFSTFDHSIATSFLLEIPSNLGTPGAPNSRLLAAPAPALSHLRHQPAVPTAADPVLVTVHAEAPNGLNAVTLRHRPDNANANAPWESTTMHDDGLNGDTAAGDGIYTARLTQYGNPRQIVQFYVQATSQAGSQTLLPKWGAERPAMYIVDNAPRPLDLRTVRFIVSAYDMGAITGGESAKYQYKFPRLSNQYRNATAISNERDIYYNAEVRNSGSPWTRSQNLNRGKFKLPTDRRFRGHRKFFFDNDPTSNRLFNNRLARYLLYRVGHPAGENEFIRVIVNAGSAQLREDTEPVGNDMLDRLFPNGTAGNLYKIDDEWWFKDDWSRQNRNADWSYKGQDNAGLYRTEWMKRTNEDEDDYTDLVTFFKTVSGTYTEAQAARLIDVDATMQMFAVRGYIDDWDSISLRRGKNGYMYRRPGDGLFQFLHWDSDLTFGNTGANFMGNLPKVGTWIRRSKDLRVFYYYLTELIEQHTKDSARTLAWMDAEEAASSSYSINKNKFVNWFNGRLGAARSQMGANYTRPLQVLNQQWAPDHTLTLNGLAPVGVFILTVEGHPEAQTTWKSISSWELTGLRLPVGQHTLQIRPLDRRGQPAVRQGAPIAPVTFQVTVEQAPPPWVELNASPASWHLAAGQTLDLDARGSRDIDGAPLTFAWQVDPPAALWETPAPGLARGVFNLPGLSTVSLRVSNPDGDSSIVQRDAAVYGPTGFSPFNSRMLEDYWQLDRVQPRENFMGADWLALDVMSGHVVVQTTDQAARPLNAAPRLWRALPAAPDWAFETKAKLVTRRFGDFFTGIGVDLDENGTRQRVAFGLLEGDQLAVRRQALAGGIEETVFSTPWEVNEAALRVRRDTEGLHFDVRAEDGWAPQHTLSLPPTVASPEVALLTETTSAQATQVAFDYALLVDPSAASPLAGNLVLTELMYNPLGGEDYEFLELANVGTTPLDLAGARFTAGIDYTFGPTVLAPGELIVLARNPGAFTSRYGTGAARLAPGGYTGKLNNGGELLTLEDAFGQEVFSFRYSDAGNWPRRADGHGSSLERTERDGDPDKAGSWTASSALHGSPGTLASPTPPPVVINEILAHSDPPLEDALELYNQGGTAVDVSGWFLTDNPDELTRYRIPAGTIVPPHGYATFYEDQFNTNNVRTPFSFSSAHGDEAVLVATDAQGNPATFVDAVRFGPSLNGVPFGRWPNGTGPLRPLSRQTFGTDLQPWDPPAAIDLFRLGHGAPNASPRVAPVVISTIMYNPANGGDEFLELLNRTGEPAPLFDPLHGTNHWQFVGGVQFEFPPNITLTPNERVLVCGMDPALFRSRNAVPTQTRIFGPWLGNLNNAGETIELAQPDTPQTALTHPEEVGFVPYVVVERVRYDNHWPWPTEPDGQGPALARLDPDAFSDDPANWTASGASPDQDSDHDGMPDVWEQGHSLDPANPADADTDADGDGLTNLEEYLAGSDPRSPESRLQLDGLTATPGQVELRFVAADQRSYRIEYRDDLANGAWQTLQSVAAGPAREVNVVDTAPAGTTRFYRLVLTGTP